MLNVHICTHKCMLNVHTRMKYLSYHSGKRFAGCENMVRFRAFVVPDTQTVGVCFSVCEYIYVFMYKCMCGYS